MQKNTFKLLVSFVFSVFLGVNQGIAQKSNDFMPGFVITSGQDTLRGYIASQDRKNFQTCLFKRNLEDSVFNYSPSDLNGYRFDNGKFFVSKVIPIDSEKKQLFVEFLIQGKVNLYYLRDENFDRYFIEKENTRIVELSQRPQRVIVSGTMYERPNTYKNTLSYLLADCNDIAPVISKTNLTHSSLIFLAKDYHTRVCNTEQCIVFEKKNNPVKVTFSVFPGFYLNKLKFGNQLPSNIGSGGLIGCRIEFHNISKWTSRLSFTLDAVVKRFSQYTLTEVKDEDHLHLSLPGDAVTYNGKSFTLDSYYFPHSMDVDLKMTALSLPISLRYTFDRGKAKPYLGSGFSNMIVLGQNESFDLKRFSKVYGKSIPAFHIGFSGLMGIKYPLPNKHFLFLEFTYEYLQSAKVSPVTRFMNTAFMSNIGITF